VGASRNIISLLLLQPTGFATTCCCLLLPAPQDIVAAIQATPYSVTSSKKGLPSPTKANRDQVWRVP
jgi:hypothetical protein